MLSMEELPWAQLCPEPLAIHNDKLSLSVIQSDFRDETYSYETTAKPIRQHKMLVLNSVAPTGIRSPEGHLGREWSEKSSWRTGRCEPGVAAWTGDRAVRSGNSLGQGPGYGRWDPWDPTLQLHLIPLRAKPHFWSLAWMVLAVGRAWNSQAEETPDNFSLGERQERGGERQAGLGEPEGTTTSAGHQPQPRTL